MQSSAAAGPRRAVILAAGDGGRLNHLTAELPKPLVQVSGRPIVSYTLEALRAAAVRDVLVVTGYREAQVRNALAESPGLTVSFASNPRFEGGASLSLRAARPFCGRDPFLLLMADHLFSPELIVALLSAWTPGGPCLVAADGSERGAGYADEATRLALAPRRAGQPRMVTAIGKGLDRYHTLDAGAFIVQPDTWDALDAVPEDCELSDIGRELIRRGRLAAVDVSGMFWYDVDTPDDLLAAETLLAAASGR